MRVTVTDSPDNGGLRRAAERARQAIVRGAARAIRGKSGCRRCVDAIKCS
jgi:hypothetical protein